jgi:3-methylcrotonyl-CoA carboxylase alpha subunit
MADESYHIGGPLALDSYLNSDRILSVARLTSSEAIHPGYGFLSENQEFAISCAEADVKFIGPSPQAMAQMASKSDSKNIMESAKNAVPVTPGYHGENQEPGFL